MLRMRVWVCLVGVALLAGGALSGDEPKKEVGVRGKGTLPQNWSKLGLTDEQKQQVYAVRDQYRTKISALEQQIRELRRQERRELDKILTASQKQRLREIIADKTPGAGGDEKKPGKDSPDKKP